MTKKSASHRRIYAIALDNPLKPAEGWAMLADAIQRCGHHSLFQWHLLQLQALGLWCSNLSECQLFAGNLGGNFVRKNSASNRSLPLCLCQNPNERRGTTRFGWTFFLFISSNKANSGCKVYVRPVYRGIYLPNPFRVDASSYVLVTRGWRQDFRWDESSGRYGKVRDKEEDGLYMGVS